MFGAWRVGIGGRSRVEFAAGLVFAAEQLSSLGQSQMYGPMSGSQIRKTVLYIRTSTLHRTQSESVEFALVRYPLGQPLNRESLK